MTENNPPQNPASSTPTTASHPPGDSSRGMPYYEKLRKDLRESLQKKRHLDQSLSTLEDSITRLESSYLEDTATAGNIVRGFDNYIKAALTSSTNTQASAPTGTATRRKGAVTDVERIFSRSSATVTRDYVPGSNSVSTPGGLGNGAGYPAVNGGSGNSSGAGTPAGVSSRDRSAGGLGTPTASTLNGRKKKLDGADEDEGRVKRGKISYGRD